MKQPQRLFFSYSREQLYIAETLVKALQEKDYDIWFDLQKLTPGTNWKQGIEKGLSESDGLILLASRAALRSTYVQKEIADALAGGKPIYVLLVNHIRLPTELKNAPQISLRRGIAGMVDLLTCAISGQPFTDPIPMPFLPSEPEARFTTLYLAALAIVVGVFGYSLFQNREIAWLNAIYRIFIPFPDLRQTVNIFIFAIAGLIAYTTVQYTRQRVVNLLLLRTILTTTGLSLIVFSAATFWLAFFLNAGIVPILVSMTTFTLGVLNLNFARRFVSSYRGAYLWIPKGGLTLQSRLSAHNLSNTTKRYSAQYSQSKRLFFLQYAAKDEAIGAEVRKTLKGAGCIEAYSILPNCTLVSILTSNLKLADLTEVVGKADYFIPILAGAPSASVIEFIRNDYQIFDYRLGNKTQLGRLAEYLAAPSLSASGKLGSAVTPQAINYTSVLMRYESLRRRDERFIKFEMNLLTFSFQLIGLLFFCPICMAIPTLLQPSYSLTFVQRQQTQDISATEFEINLVTKIANLTAHPLTATPTPLPSPTPIRDRVAHLSFALPATWKLDSSFTTAPFDDMIKQHPSGESVWAAHADNIWVLAVYYRDETAFRSYSISHNLSLLSTSVDIPTWIFGKYVALKPRFLQMREWIFFIQSTDTLVMMHVLVNGDYALNDDPPKSVIDFIRSAAYSP